MSQFERPSSLKELALRQVYECIKSDSPVISKIWRKRSLHTKLQLIAHNRTLRNHLKPIARVLPHQVSTYAITEEGMLSDDTETVWTNGRRMKSLLYHAESDPDGLFWSSHRVAMTRLLKLELSPAYMDIPEQTMVIISETCSRLEVIKFNFRSTTLQGISHLRAIKSLRVIKDTQSQEFFQEENKAHVDLLNVMLKELPKLEFITCHCIGDILADLTDVQNLSLKHICIRRPTEAKIDAVVRLCPDLVSLNLTMNQYLFSKILFRFPFSFLESYFFSYFTTLSNSSLKIRFLELYCTGMKFIKQIEDFITIKGYFLNHLIVTSFDGLSIEQVKIIGRNCPFIEELEISDSSDSLNRYIPCETNERMFENLEKFITNVTGLLLPCLAHAEEIRSVYLGRQRNNASIEKGNEIQKALTELITRNPMSELCTLVIDRLGYEFSLHLIKYLFNLPSLDCLLLEHIKSTPELMEYLEDLSDESSMVLHWDS